MNPPQTPALQGRTDDFSYQVFTAADQRFWFRLERRYDCDVITDFLLGAFPGESAPALLAECYRVLGLTPGKSLVFRDIVPSSGAADPAALARARDTYAAAGTALLTGAGARKVVERLDDDGEKHHLELRGEF